MFLAQASFPSIHVFDFFAGPGTDAQGSAGSPLIIKEELEQCLRAKNVTRAPGIEVTLHFNDKDCASIQRLQELCSTAGIGDLNYKLAFTCLPFASAFTEALPTLQERSTANLVLIDQFGLKEVSEHVFRLLMECQTTDVLFFISSSHIRRFISEQVVRKYFPSAEPSIRGSGAKDVHRAVCNEYRKLIPPDREYYLAPFSIEKERNPNIYGIVFGTSNLLGLQKFLTVCWSKDEITGEANYNIDQDPVREKQRELFEEYNVVKKQDAFARNLETYLKDGEPDNRQVYRFVLEGGFLPKHANAILKRLQHEGRFEVTDIRTGTEARRGAFYLSYKQYNDVPLVRFSMRKNSHGR